MKLRLKSKKSILRFLMCSFLSVSLIACVGGGSVKKKELESCDENVVSDFKAKVKYAKGFSIDFKGDYNEIKVFSPWKNDEILRTYALVPRDKELPTSLPKGATVVRTPVRSIALLSNIYVGSLLKLGLEDKLIGLTRANKVYDAGLNAKVMKGEIHNLGGAHNKNIDVERILELEPELIMLSAFNEVKSGESRLEEMGFNLAYGLSWMEITPLGRAEWMKFVAAFFNKGADAKRIFDEIESNYLELKQLTAQVKRKTNVLLGWSYGGVWYMPGGHNYMVGYLRDAGADYFLLDDDTRGNIPMSVESVLDECLDADMWIYPGLSKSMNEVENGGEIFTQFKPYKNGEVYNIYKRMNKYGGSDWWEGGCVNPDRVLKDFIKVLHPELLPQDSTYFISKLKWDSKE